MVGNGAWHAGQPHLDEPCDPPPWLEALPEEASCSDGLNEDTPLLSIVQLDPGPQTTGSAMFLKGDKKRDGEGADVSSEVDPRSKAWPDD